MILASNGLWYRTESRRLWYTKVEESRWCGGCETISFKSTSCGSARLTLETPTPPQFPPHQRRESGSELRSISEGLTVDTLPSFPLLQISLIAVQRWQWANCSEQTMRRLDVGSGDVAFDELPPCELSHLHVLYFVYFSHPGCRSRVCGSLHDRPGGVSTLLRGADFGALNVRSTISVQHDRSATWGKYRADTST